MQIDNRSFHAFEEDGEYFLFDRATGTLLTIDESSYAVLALVEAGVELGLALARTTRMFPSPDSFAQPFRAKLVQMLDAGFFRYVPVDPSEQSRLIKRLLRHKRRRLQLLAAQGCNLGCRYCYAWRNGSNQKNTLMPFHVGKQAIEFLIKQSSRRKDLNVTFFGGEALLNFRLLEEVVAYSRSRENATGKRFHFDVTTNGTLLTPNISHFLAKEQFRVMVSIDGYEEMHNFNRPSLDRTNSYEVIVKNALFLNEVYKSKGLDPIKIRANLTERHHDYYRTGRHLRDLGFDRVAISVIEPLPHNDQSPGALSEDSADQLQADRLRQVTASLESLARGETLHPFDQQIIGAYKGLSNPGRLKGISCGTGRNTQTVDVEGRIYPCHRYEGMENYIIGNVFQGIDKKALLAYYKKINTNATSRCHSCWVRDYCQGGCAWLLSAKDGHIADPTLRECNRRRRSLEISLWTNYRLASLAPTLQASLETAACQS